MKSLSHVQLFVIPWTVAYQASLSMGCSRQEYWSGVPFPSPGDLHDPGIEPGSPALQGDALPSEPPGKPARNLLPRNLPKSSQAGLETLLAFYITFLCSSPHTLFMLQHNHLIFFPVSPFKLCAHKARHQGSLVQV